VKTLLALGAAILVLALVFFRLQSESGLMALQGCKTAVGQAKSWMVETTSQAESPSFATVTNRTKVSCPDDYEYFFKSRTPDNVIKEQSTVRTGGVAYAKNLDGSWTKGPAAGDSPALKECGKGPLLVQQTVFNAIVELPRRKQGSIVKGELQTIDDGKCQDWHVEYGNEWPQTAPYTVCIDRKTHLPRRITISESGTPHDFTNWNSTTIEAPPI
jgi:hypothetical protein